MRKKDPKKVAAGRKGGRVSGGNFKNNPRRAVLAARKSARKRAFDKVFELPAPYIDEPIKFPAGTPKKIKEDAEL